ncbi:hypothetical protein Plhal304r1_c055g0140531 [Plasmopara halstedii]
MSTEFSCRKFLDALAKNLAKLYDSTIGEVFNRRIHDGKVPTTSKGKSYVILPHAIFSDDRIDRYKTIVTRANVVFEATELAVKR